ncbi:GTP-binding protein [Methanosarcina sp. 2.H.T.1A.6]|jgi:nucleolar GTP-binding protein|uniref:NOG1 family protein n=1 Tax=unclassified Methanosarcina TaxID=2644672 RepID=UPI0006214017|nr:MULTISPECIES: NOG1 family protein [unclassified Methanosarcina]KKG09189.1 GTP-binding protein [Methanosarcina sp. 2.H.A.1B.4]KKG15000.1 GTP-binding protein [Methanosarcina sp. 2.H.T.1A.3]KKG20699.1 GTP-binding protein [Methanosarcina sp. 2.H.T.1A.8]KKG22016.1 GTP-binding protein [Methanosarcina sp. 2.H.T.1A.6]KKG28653.1 GTP-binding protein [Methanosarcina sp. 2.H.T.1A.15]
MIFEKIHTVPTSEELTNKAFKRAARAMSGKTIEGRDSRLRANESMVLTAANIFTDNLANIVRRFPSFEQLPTFYYELTDVLVGVEKLKMSLASVDWASRKIHEVARSYVGKIRDADLPEPVRKEAFGRIASIVKSINKDLLFLNEARNILRKLPDVQDEPTIVIAGYPNVGKSSFVTKITGATPEIAPYPFTTKGVTIGHFTRDGVRYQVMDTPGLLDRPMAERNNIERQAITAIHFLDAVVMFIIDPSESCGYEIEDQKRLLAEIRENFNLPMLVVANKADRPEFRKIDEVELNISTITEEGIEEVMSKLLELIEEKRRQSLEEASTEEPDEESTF